MAEQDTHQYTADIRGEETNKDPVSASDDKKQEEPEKALNVNQQEEDSASLTASTKRETKKGNDEDMKQADGENDDSGEKPKVPEKSEESSSPDEPVKDNSSPPQADDRSHGDSSRVTHRNKQLSMKGEDISGKCHRRENEELRRAQPPTQGGKTDQVDGTGATFGEDAGKNTKAGEGECQHAENEELEPTPLMTTRDKQNDQVGEPDPRLTEESSGTNNKNKEAGEDGRSGLNKASVRISQQSALSQEISDEQKNKVEDIGPATHETTEPGSPEGSRRYLLALGVGLVVLAILVQHLLQPDSPPPKDDVRQIDIFLRQLDKLKTQFPNQRAELWSRSKIHLLRHLQTAQPTEPVSLLLTAGVKAEQTLRCLAEGLASAFSSALNASTLHIDGATKASQDSDQVKLDIDSKLQGAFEGDKPVAVIHRFEELPPGSTLIFYRYCDHENAAYKKTCLIFTVLLGEEEEIPAKSHLSTVEEMVDDHLQKKFISDGHPVSFDRMDLDKYGGLWSRISHLILPVAAEEWMEREGCDK
ncbi:torsin-1A-interacting protein 2-like [Symphorus nematophorus]